MILILTVTVPIFVVLAAGYLAARRGIMGAESIKAFTAFVFYFCLPLMLFRSLANAPIAEQFNVYYVLAYTMAGLTAFALGYLVARWGFDCSPSERAVQGLSVSFGHTIFVTVPIVTALYGEDALFPVALLVGVEVGVTVPLCVILLEINKSESANVYGAALKAVRSVFSNPIILSILLGIGVALLDIELPKVLDGLVNLVQGAVIPAALFAIGASLAGLTFSERAWQTGCIVCGKLLVYPLLVFAYMSAFTEIPQQWKYIAVIAAATPIGASVYLVASTYDTFVKRASAATLVSTIFSVVTLSALVVLVSRTQAN